MVRCSVLSVPGASERMLHKALASEADEIVIDLEDAVTADAKDGARATVVRFLTDLEQTNKRIAVRVNATGSPWANDDLIAMASLPRVPDSVVVPKVESAGDLGYVDRLLTGAEARSGRATKIAVQALIESAAGLVHLDEICASTARLDSLVLGYADLAASLRRDAPERWLAAQERVLWSARAAGLAAVDGPFLGVSDDDNFRAALQTAVSAGFDAKWVIHPAQLEAVNLAFLPSPEEIAWAQGVIAALTAAHGAAVQSGGQMIDEAVAVRARQVIARAR